MKLNVWKVVLSNGPDNGLTEREVLAADDKSAANMVKYEAASRGCKAEVVEVCQLPS